MTASRSDPSNGLERVVQHPTLRLAFGIITAALGAVVIFWPGHPVAVVSVLLGAQLIVSATFRFISALGTVDAQQWARVMNVVAGVTALIAGVFFLRHPYSLGTGPFLLGLLLGIFWIVTGVMDVFVLLSHPQAPRRGTTAVIAVLSLIVGIVVIINPSGSMATIAWALGGFLLALGVITIVQALLLRQRPALGARTSPER